MTIKEYQNVKSSINLFKYSSIHNLDEAIMHEYSTLNMDDKLVLLRRYNVESKRTEYHWAANEASTLLNAMEKKPNLLVTFVPHEWIKAFEAAGFLIFAAWHDYFKQSLDDIDCIYKVEILDESDCETASGITLSCSGQSRGFTGQTSDWMYLWLKGKEPSVQNSHAKHNTILIQRNNYREIVGIVCTATYAHESEKGAIVWIREIAVKPEYQQQGYGKRLILQALAYGKAHGATRAFLAADECNHHAIHLYRSLGFAPSEEAAQIDMIHN